MFILSAVINFSKKQFFFQKQLSLSPLKPIHSYMHKTFKKKGQDHEDR